MKIVAPATNGEVYEKIVTEVTTGCELVQKGLVEVHPTNTMADEFAVVVRSAKDLDVDYSANPSAKETSDINYSTKLVKLGKNMLFYNKVRAQEFENVYRKYQPTGDFVLESLAPEILADLFAIYAEQYGEVMNDQTIDGKRTLNADQEGLRFDGIMTQLKAATALTEAGADKPVKVAGAAVDTPEKAVATLDKIFKGTAAKVRRQKDWKIAVSVNILDLFHQSQYAQSGKGVDITQAGVSRYRGVELHSIDSLGDNDAFATVMSLDSNSNLIMPVAGVAAHSFEFDKMPSGSEYYFLKMVWKQGLGIKKIKEVTYHTA